MLEYYVTCRKKVLEDLVTALFFVDWETPPPADNQVPLSYNKTTATGVLDLTQTTMTCLLVV